MNTRLLLSVVVLVSACGDDGVHHLADAPELPIDAAVDSPDAADPKVPLNIMVSGSGGGTVTSSPAGITCTTASCSADFDPETVVTLTAVPDTGSVFVGWMGACTGTVPTCEVTLAQAASVTATFDIARYAVTVTKSGTGVGVVAGNGLNCGATCTVMVDHGTMLSLTATPGTLSVFAGWGGACSGMATCATTVTGPTAITANFALDDVTLFVTKGGNGAGTVTATGINCGADCNETYTAGQMVTLTAAASTGSTFTGWTGGGCTGTATCTLTMTAATTVTATFTLQQFALTVTKAGNGGGTVVSNPTGIACGADCSENLDYNTMVVLTATASTGSTFTGWTGACTGTAMCMVTMTAARSVTATFTLQTFALTVTTAGNGSGTVTSAPAGVACPGDCSQSYNYGTMVTLTQAAATGSTFTGWGGSCTGTGACTVTIDAAKTVTATFTLNTFALTVAKAGNGMGTVTATGISCGADCTETYNFGTMVTLTQAATTGSTFAGWSGACTGTGACTVTIDAAKTVTATFNIQTFTLTASTIGNGSGTITSAPAGISCPGDCTQVYNYNTMVTLTAPDTTSSTFTGWGGACTGTGACMVTMTAARSVTATFTLRQFTLTVNRTGNGTVTSSPAGISCGADCDELYNYNTPVTLTASAGTGSTFGGWSGGGCSGTALTCLTTVTAATTVNATFNVSSFLLTVTPAGLGTGTVTSSPAGINCGADCMESYLFNTPVTLTATADPVSSDFGGWNGGGCTGTAPCTVTMSQAQNVTATFNLKQFALRVRKGGDGFGTVSGNGINCGPTCTVEQVMLPYGTTVTLSQAAATSSSQLSTFTGWSGACAGAGGCSFMLMGNTTVGADFKLRPNLMFTTSMTTTGAFIGINGADSLCKNLASARGLPGAYLAYISGTNTAAPSRFAGVSGWVRVDNAPVMSSIGQFGGGSLFNPPILDEAGANLANSGQLGVWTATRADGTYVGQNCNNSNSPADWSTTSARTTAGACSATDSTVVDEGFASCVTPLRIYCLGVDRAATVP
ncbi:MAG: InlB B-repeat-containing protein [Deltaproteobacteria bacterium]|nr:InlB B-repeat-containing protein [Deltaproteobacteria bacterium]